MVEKCPTSFDLPVDLFKGSLGVCEWIRVSDESILTGARSKYAKKMSEIYSTRVVYPYTKDVPPVDMDIKHSAKMWNLVIQNTLNAWVMLWIFSCVIIQTTDHFLYVIVGSKSKQSL